MSKRYCPEYKQLVLRLIKQAFRGSIPEASRFTGVPQRTLRDWRREQQKTAARPLVATTKSTQIARRRV